MVIGTIVGLIVIIQSIDVSIIIAQITIVIFGRDGQQLKCTAVYNVGVVDFVDFRLLLSLMLMLSGVGINVRRTILVCVNMIWVGIGLFGYRRDRMNWLNS